MIAQELINSLVPTLRSYDDTAKATSLMDDLMMAQLPVVEEDTFCGFITNDMLFDDFVNHTTRWKQYQLKDKECVRCGRTSTFTKSSKCCRIATSQW